VASGLDTRKNDMQYDAPSEKALRKLNALTIDVEAFVEANLQSFQIDSKLQDIVLQNREVERNMECLLTIFHQLGLTATFFFNFISWVFSRCNIKRFHRPRHYGIFRIPGDREDSNTGPGLYSVYPGRSRNRIPG